MTDISAIKEALEKKLEILEGRVERINENLSQPHDDDWADRASDLEGDEALEEVGAMAEAAKVKIRLALAKIKDGTYGKCSECGCDISAARLEALPHASCCIKCTEEAANS